MKNKYYSTTVKDVPLTVSLAAYAANDVVGGRLAIPIFDRPISGMITNLILGEKGTKKAAFNVYLFDAPPTVFADNDPFAPSSADLQHLIGGRPLSIVAADYLTINGTAVAAWPAVDSAEIRPFASDSGTVWVYLVTQDTPAYGTVDDLFLRLGAMVDV